VTRQVSAANDEGRTDGPGVSGHILLLPRSGWRRRIPLRRSESWLGMAVGNRLHEWHWFISHHVHRMLGREMTWPPHTMCVDDDGQAV
jgi:hypothetical protein